MSPSTELTEAGQLSWKGAGGRSVQQGPKQTLAVLAGDVLATVRSLGEGAIVRHHGEASH